MRQHLVVHTKANDLCQEGARETGAHQLLISTTQRRFIQAFTNHASGKLIHLQAEERRTVCIWVDLTESE